MPRYTRYKGVGGGAWACGGGRKQWELGGAIKISAQSGELHCCRDANWGNSLADLRHLGVVSISPSPLLSMRDCSRWGAVLHLRSVPPAFQFYEPHSSGEKWSSCLLLPLPTQSSDTWCSPFPIWHEPSLLPAGLSINQIPSGKQQGREKKNISDRWMSCRHNHSTHTTHTQRGVWEYRDSSPLCWEARPGQRPSQHYYL